MLGQASSPGSKGSEIARELDANDVSLLATLKKLAQASYVNDDGEPRQLQLLPPLTRDELEKLRSSLPCPLPSEVEEALLFSRGLENVEHTDGQVDLSGLSIQGQWLEDFAPHAVAIASDGCGNSWSLDLGPDSSHWGPVYYFCHDPPVIVYQFAHAEELLNELQRPPSDSDLGALIRHWADRIYAKDPMAQPYSQAIEGDEQLRKFAQPLGPGFHFIDLRHPKPGDGFNWGRFGPSTRVLRHAHLPLVAVEIPPKSRARSLWQRLWGK